jgi:hypothetical protein
MGARTLSDMERKLLQHVARDTESREHGGGWVIYGTPCPPPDFEAAWEWDDYRPLVARGLLDRCEDWKHVYVRLTDAGWKALSQPGAGE